MRQYRDTQPDPGQTSATLQRPPLFVAQLPSSSHGRRQIQRVLIANRGEIACRIIATCRKLDLTSIAIYAQEDSSSRHVAEADEAVNLGSINQTGGNPFLNIPLLVDVARSQGADAIHPGYGYLSENKDFADAVRQAGMIFIGPSSQAMSTLGDKRNSKDYLRKHAPSVPLIPGFTGSSQNVKELESAAEKVGFPVMLKASAGGGGRGMRIVRERSQLAGELARAQSEAQRSFGSSDCILEKYIEAAKHVEVQIIGDSHGKVLSLWERECSVQRRHQKIIEETPSPFLTPEQRQRMCAVAVQIGELIGYEGAGTVEFVVDARDGSFYFLEVNTRLQVEHPITEEVTGLDVVSLQLFVAAGGSLASLSVLQHIPQKGHAIECRLCAEDPSSDFMPQNGTIQLWRESDQYPSSRDVRYETSVQTGSTISIYFDSMIAKIVVWAPTRSMAISKMVKVLANTVCAGVKTNQLFLQACLLHQSFHDPAYTTSLIPTHVQSLLKNPYTESVQDMISMLSLVPGLVLRGGASPLADARPFKHVTRGFRNQYFDPVNRSTTVIVPSEPSSAQTPMLSVWSAHSRGESGHSKYEATLVPIPTDENDQAPDTSSRDPEAYQISRQYHAISHKLRDPSLANAPQYTVEFTKWKDMQDPTGDNAWRTASVAISINQSIIHAHIATDTPSNPASSTASYQTVLCHFRGLGTWVEYKCYSVLNYMESLRQAVGGGGGSLGGSNSKVIKSPMPCKVLSVLKANGDQVKAGEVVMVIESMKMETNICINVDGKFMTGVKNGDAVNDGAVLCWVE
ncbi:Biotin carboxylase domain-containing protein [Cladophialophora immunda]|nr:Biotin carboxylase domain-containing protein [Cladophialophora immunda]